jgi:hypothetical protein
MSNYRFLLVDEFGGALRKFATRREAQPYMTGGGVQLLSLPKQPSLYELATLTLKEALI